MVHLLHLLRLPKRARWQVSELRTINDAGIREGPIILNDIDWSELESTFKDCFSQEIKDDQEPHIFWGWRTPNNEGLFYCYRVDRVLHFCSFRSQTVDNACGILTVSANFKTYKS
jgi:hypothetical protein